MRVKGDKIRGEKKHGEKRETSLRGVIYKISNATCFVMGNVFIYIFIFLSGGGGGASFF